MTVDEPLVSEITAGLAEVRSNTVSHCELEWALADLSEIWNPSHHLICACPAALAVEDAKPPKRPPPWYLGWSSSFRKAVDKIDRTIQGRILEALSDIAENPVMIRGDTVKPLMGELKGCWRYRIGDFRLVYSPDRTTGNITLLAFEARGSAYED